MSKITFLFVAILTITQLAVSDVFSFGSKLNPVTTEITQQGNDLLIRCTFKEQTKFDSDKNAKFNRMKADEYCQKGLLLYYGKNNGEAVAMDGILVEKKPERSNGQIIYFFRKIGACEQDFAQHDTAVPHSYPPQKQLPAPSHDEHNENTEQATAAKTDKGCFLIVRYIKKNNQMSVVDTINFQSECFKNPQEFNDFCDKMFQEINQKANMNREEILNKYDAYRKKILKK